MEFIADFFDGMSARAKHVKVRVLESDRVIVLEFLASNAFSEAGMLPVIDVLSEAISFSKMIIQPSLGKVRRIIELPEGGRLEAEDIAGLDTLIQQDSMSGFWRRLHSLENHLQSVFLVSLLTVFACWGLLKYGVPLLAEEVARATPISAEKSLGEQVLAAMDHQHAYFKFSQIPQLHQDAIRQQLLSVCGKLASGCPEYHLEFRESESIGANAITLPGGFIVVTDALISLSKNDDEVIAVLAHEIGHAHYRHPLRQALQGALAGLSLAAVTGDVSSIASGLPAVLLQLSYSRDMETDADQYALNALHASCIQPQAFANILARLTKQAHVNNVPEFVSSHPDTQARIKPFNQVWKDCSL
jgi:Zn-dependent protease with chaperone function